jgi:hypothetical protein
MKNEYPRSLQAAAIILLIFIAILLITLCTSCGVVKDHYVKKYCKPSSNIKDSIVLIYKDSIRINFKDSIVIIKGGNIESEINNPCDTNGLLKDFEQRFKSGNNTTIITGKNGKIYIKSNCEDQINKYKEQVAYLLTQVGENKVHTEYQTQIIEVQLSWWEKLKSGWFGDGCFIIALSFLLYALYKIKSKFK